MRQGIALLFSALLILPSGGAAYAGGQDKTTSKADDKAQLISTAQITKIDAKKQTLKVRNVAASQNDGSTGTAQNTGGRRTGGSVGIPGGMGIPGAGGRRGGGRGGSPTGPTNPSNQQLGPEYTVYIGKTTAIKNDDDHPMNFQDFKVGDRINITGTQKGSGKDMNASVISRAGN